MRNIYKLIFIFIFHVSIILPLLWAENKPEQTALRIKLSELPTIRTSSPFTLHLHFNYLGNVILNGKLKVEIKAENLTLLSYISDEIVLSQGESQRRFLIPGLPLTNPHGEGEIKLSFNTAERDYEFKSIEVRLPEEYCRHLSIAIVNDPAIASSTIPKQKLESIISITNRESKQYLRSTFYCETSSLDYGDCPSSPLACCQYDKIWIDRCLSDLTSKQKGALKRWVWAGGVLILQENMDNATSILQNFTDDILEISRKKMPNLVGKGNSFRGFESGLGRILLINTNLFKENLNRSKNNEIFSYIWRLRSTTSEELINTGDWHKSEDVLLDSPGGYFPVIIPIGSSINTLLMPESFTNIPLSFIFAFLTIFIVFIGPGELYLLRKFRMRIYTWITFPMLCTIFAGAYIVAADWHMGSADSEKKLRITDVATGGAVLRENKFSTLVCSKQKQVHFEGENAILTPLGYQGLFGGNKFFEKGNEISCDGSFPTAYKINEEFDKWTPKVRRKLEIPDQKVDKWANWDKDLKLNNAKRVSSVKSFKFFKNWKDFDGGVYLWKYEDGILLRWTLYENDFFAKKEKIKKAIFGFINKTSCRNAKSENLLKLVSSFSPSGGDDLSDMIILDEDSNNSLLTVIRSEDEGFAIYRQLYECSDSFK